MDTDAFATKTDLTLLHAEIKGDIDAFKVDLFKWMIITIGGQTIAILSMLYVWTHQ